MNTSFLRNLTNKKTEPTLRVLILIVCVLIVSTAILTELTLFCHSADSHGHLPAERTCSTCLKIIKFHSEVQKLSIHTASFFAIIAIFSIYFLMSLKLISQKTSTLASSKVRLNI